MRTPRVIALALLLGLAGLTLVGAPALPASAEEVDVLLNDGAAGPISDEVGDQAAPDSQEADASTREETTTSPLPVILLDNRPRFQSPRQVTLTSE